ncbi:MAG: hypothetical protein MI923_10850 [Phycisphaerales bacterium]|nr:hypothetical protein [Phycisphaerales bacterium]
MQTRAFLSVLIIPLVFTGTALSQVRPYERNPWTDTVGKDSRSQPLELSYANNQEPDRGADIIMTNPNAREEPQDMRDDDMRDMDDSGAWEEADVGDEEAYEETDHSDPEPILWKGFLYGDQHFRDKPRPIGSPLYFEDPFINSDIRPLFIWHKFPGGSALRGGQLTVGALQARIALTERLQFMATCDGYSHLESPILDDDSGWNDIAVGLKYAMYVDHENDFIVSTGVKWRLSNGHAQTLHGNVDELTPFLTAYKGHGKWNFMANLAYRLPMEWREGNSSLNWDLHIDYELFENFFPLLEIHGFHYLTNGNRLPLDIGGLDYANIGSNDVAGQSVFWGTVGFRWNLMDHVSWGVGYGFPLQNPDNNDIYDQRVTSNLILTF